MGWLAASKRIFKRHRMLEVRGIRSLNNRDIYINPDKRFAWVSNPKVASTSIRHSLTGEQASLDPVYRMQQARDVLGKQLPIDEVIAEINRIYTFAFVRHPEQRLISAYRNKIARRMAPKPATRPKMQILQGLGLDPADINREVSFEQFLSVIFDSDATQLNRHWRPQVLVLDIDAVRYSHIGKLETFEASWREICRALQLDADVILNSLAQQGHRKQSSATRDTPLVTERQRAAIRAYYREDFERFGYR